MLTWQESSLKIDLEKCRHSLFQLGLSNLERTSQQGKAYFEEATDHNTHWGDSFYKHLRFVCFLTEMDTPSSFILWSDKPRLCVKPNARTLGDLGDQEQWDDHDEWDDAPAMTNFFSFQGNKMSEVTNSSRGWNKCWITNDSWWMVLTFLVI